MTAQQRDATKASKVPPVTRRHKRILRKLLYLDQQPVGTMLPISSLTRLVNFNKALVDALKANGLIEFSAHFVQGRLDWHVRLSESGRQMALLLGAMRPVAPYNTSAQTRWPKPLERERTASGDNHPRAERSDDHA